MSSIIMSDVRKHICLISDLALVLAATIPVIFSAPITSQPVKVQQRSDALDIAAVAPTCDSDSYWDSENEACLKCVFCPRGMGSTAQNCGDGVGERGICKECIDGVTFQDQTSTKGQCNRCRQCDSNASIISNCTKDRNTQCGPCNDGYGSHPNSPELCSRCDLLNNDEKPPECLITPTPPATDIDECALSQDTCDTSVSTCNNTIGSYTCECLPGYMKNTLDQCVDINECTLDLDSCDTSVSRCINTNGSYTCDCLPGYDKAASNQCVDVNECELNQTSCNVSVSRCKNTNGSYICDCLEGYNKNATQCVVITGNESSEVNAGVNVGIVAVIVVIVGLIVVILLTARWYKKRKRKGSRKTAEDELEMERLNTEGDTTTNGHVLDQESPADHVTPDDSSLVANGNIPGITPTVTQSSGAPDAGQDGPSLSIEVENEDASFSAKANDLRTKQGNISVHSTLIRPQVHDSPSQTANENISNHMPEELQSSDPSGDDDGDEVEEPNTVLIRPVHDDRAIQETISVLHPTQVPLISPWVHDSPTANGNISNHMPEELQSSDPSGDDGDEVDEPNTNTSLDGLRLSNKEMAENYKAGEAPGQMEKRGGTDSCLFFKRSISMPANVKNEVLKKKEGSPTSVILPDDTQQKLVEMDEKDRKDKFQEDYQKALILGKNIQWKDLDVLFREEVNKLMKTENGEKGYKIFGERMGLDRKTDLKDCSDLKSVFDQLEMSLTTEVFMDKVLQTLKAMKRNDIVREIVREIINKKPTGRGDASG